MISFNMGHRQDLLLRTPNLVAFWDFQSDALQAHGPFGTTLRACGEPLEWGDEGVFGPRSLRFSNNGILGRSYLTATPREAPELSIGGADAEVTVIAWIKREPSEYTGCEFVAGVWNEHGRRQYGMFLNLKIWESREQIGAHVSSHGGATPGYRYCMDVAIGATPIDWDQWHCAAMTYDGTEARVYLDGILDVREPQGEPGRNPFHYPGGLLAGDADFTVGAVERPARVLAESDGTFREEGAVVANPFIGLLGGLAIFRRALTTQEIRNIASR